MKRVASLLAAGTLLLAAPLFAAAPVFTNNFVAVTLDGVRLGTDTDPSNYSMFPTVVYDSSSGLFHMWVTASNALSIEGLRHATSSDGVHFISDGSLSFAGGSPFPIYGAPVEPQFEFPRAAKIGADWKLLIWTENGAPGLYGDYNYNESVNDIGADPSTLAVSHQGPVYPTNGLGTFGQTTGPFGIVAGKLFVADDRIGGISKWGYDDTTPPSVTPPADMYQDLITGTGYVYFLTHPGDPLGVYVHNVGRVLDQGDGTLGVYYSLRHPDGSRINKQIYYSQSGDGGQTWSAPAGLFSNGDAVRVDGAPNQFDFSHPEVTLVGARRVLYFSTKALDGAYVVATSAAQSPQATNWSDLIGSGVGDGDSGVAVVRTDDGGYAVLGQGYGLSGGAANFWLLKLDGAGEVEWQRLYLGSGGLNTFFPTALARAADGGFVMGGLRDLATRTAWIIKTDALGNVVWSKSYVTCDSGNCAFDVRGLVATTDGGFAFVGGYSAFGLGKIDGNGNLLWIHNYPSGAVPSYSNALVEASDGGLAVAGSVGPSLQPDYRIMRTDASGAVLWDESIGANNAPDSASAIAARPTGGFVVTGESSTIALDDSGNPDWQFHYLGEGAGGRGIVASPSGGFGLVGGGFQGSFGHATLLEIDAAGAPLWARSFASQITSYASFGSAVPTFDGGFLAVGTDTVYGTPPAYGNSRLLAVKVDAGGDFVGCLDVDKSDTVIASPTSLSPVPLSETVVDETANTTVSDAPVTVQDTDPALRLHCSGTLPETLEPTALTVDPQGNGVVEPGEAVVAEPAWTNSGLVATFLSGHASALSDSNGLDTSAPDPDAGYGIVPSLGTVNCEGATGDCYQFQFDGTPRPAQHWDTYADETLTTSDPHHQFAKRWVIHIGQSFTDVSSASAFYPFIEDIFHNGITGGCGTGIFCPGNPVTRAQMSVFLLKSKHGRSFTPPACTGIFADVPCPSQFADWIEDLAAEGITAGCGGGNFCAADPVTRQQMAVFLRKALNGSGYVPPACSGIFGDVACPSLFANWVEDLYNRGITAGCSTSPLLYCPTNPNTRQQMAVFLVKTFSLVLYGP
jgi:hypothetical protein